MAFDIKRFDVGAFVERWKSKEDYVRKVIRSSPNSYGSNAIRYNTIIDRVKTVAEDNKGYIEYLKDYIRDSDDKRFSFDHIKTVFRRVVHSTRALERILDNYEPSYATNPELEKYADHQRKAWTRLAVLHNKAQIEKDPAYRASHGY